MVNGFRPQNLSEALALIAEHELTPYGGGTDLMIEAMPHARYLFLDRVPEMREIKEDFDYIRIGAAVSFSEALLSKLVPQIMKDAVGQIAAPAIRNLGTFGGNIGNGSAKADSVLVEFVLDARLRLCSVRGERVVGISDFYKGRKKLDLQKGELIVEILLPKPIPQEYYYKKVGARNALAISRVSFAATMQKTGDVIDNIAVAFGAVSDTVLRFGDLEAILKGKTISEAKSLRENFIAEYDKAIVPTSGRVSSEYRRAVCLNLLSDFLDGCGI